ncbi:hypothetical protein BCO18442_00726 [Burkholderia contaminans]|nr:hypothetical protein BCO18442_00726 [Burkholderia contaminans]
MALYLRADRLRKQTALLQTRIQPGLCALVTRVCGRQNARVRIAPHLCVALRVHPADPLRLYVTLNRGAFLPRQRIDADIDLLRSSLGGFPIRLFRALVDRNHPIRFGETKARRIDTPVAKPRRVPRLLCVPFVEQSFNLVACASIVSLSRGVRLRAADALSCRLCFVELCHFGRLLASLPGTHKVGGDDRCMHCNDVKLPSLSDRSQVFTDFVPRDWMAASVTRHMNSGDCQGLKRRMVRNTRPM